MKKYDVIPQIINLQTRQLMTNTLNQTRENLYFLTNTDRADYKAFTAPGSVTDTCWDIYAPAITEGLLATLKPIVEAHWAVELLPTYSYARYHWQGARMVSHRDRPSCEYSLTLNLMCDPAPWPIFMDGEAVILNPGDAATYKGCEVNHWREEFTGSACLQVFLHYVDAQGPNKHLAYDGRPQLGLRPNKK
jgi:hypothetical protein